MLSYNDMNKEQKHSLKKVLFVFIIGTVFSCVYSNYFSLSILIN